MMVEKAEAPSRCDGASVFYCGLVLGQRLVDLVGPSGDAAGQVLHVGEACGLQCERGFLAAAASLAVDDDLLVLADGDLVEALVELADGDQWSTEVHDLVLVRLADVEDEGLAAFVKLGLELLDGELWDAVDLGKRCNRAVRG